MNQWTKEEIGILNEYDSIGNELASMPMKVIEEDQILALLKLEAQLLILNKPVIGYAGSTPEGIYSFNEALKREKYYILRGEVFTYHPINFIDQKEFIAFS